MPASPPVAVTSAPSDPAPASLGTIPAERLFAGRQEILIAHNGDTYRLRITKNGKLILTK